MKQFIMKNKFLVISILALIVMSFVDIQLTYAALDNTLNQVISMLLIVPPIFIMIGLMDVWVPRETIISLMGEGSKARGMFLAFFLGAFSAGPTIVAFPIAHLMLKKGAKYSNVMFFLMVWSSLKLPILFYQVTAIGLYLPSIINSTLLVLFIISALLSDKLFTKEEQDLFLDKANKMSAN